MRYLTLSEVLDLYRQVIERSGGAVGILSLGGLESAIAQPRMSYGGADLYSSVIEKAGALGFSLVQNHPFVDGNKRTAHAAMETFLMMNGFELNASVDEQTCIILQVASGLMKREGFVEWLRGHIVNLK
jgi:death-on-curing protein